MVTEKTLKKELEALTRKDPDSYYPTKVLYSLGFKRAKCKSCGMMFWSTSNREVCGEPACIGGYKFIGKAMKKKLDFIQVWTEFSSFMKKRGYTPIKRYPLVARWRNDQYWTGASIYDFQPYVVNGLVDPPANPLVVPQTCVRFNDIDNVGLSGRHNSCFVMIGQHAFTKPQDFNQDKYFRDLVEFIISIGVPISELIIHEDQWSGGGNMGPSMELFTGGLELCNQVYMKYEVTTTGLKPLKLNVLDMGLGQNRISWITSGTNTMYEAIYPTVCKKLFKITGVKVPSYYKDFLPFSGLLNADEVDLDKAWKQISKELKVDVQTLKDSILPLAAVFSIADHCRTLLIAIADGAIPSNTGGGYDIRSLYRRAFNFIKDYEWNIKLVDVCKWHADYLKPMYPELIKAMPQVKKILAHEEKKFLKTRLKWKSMIKSILKKGAKVKDLLEAYNSHGLSPQLVVRAGLKQGVKVKVPDDFYNRVSALHVRQEEEQVKPKLLKVSDLPSIDKLCYHEQLEFKARVLRVKKNLVVLNKTAFFATSGGQEHDTGLLGGVRVVDVVEQGNQVVHVLKHAPGFKEGDIVKGVIDAERRYNLMRNHTATHIINGACRQILGDHVWQAGSKVSESKAHLDITHYDLLTNEEVEAIETLANKVVSKGLSVRKKEMPRAKAELEYGFRLYQGGDVPRKSIRVIDVRGHDVEACGGTHVHNTKDIKQIKIVKTSKVQDGVVRLEYVTAVFAEKLASKDSKIISEAESITGLKSRDSVEDLSAVFSVQPEHLVKTINRFMAEAKSFGAPKEELIKGEDLKSGLEHLFKTWKKYRKLAKRSK